ncbi:polysaccharide deacetylase family protein [Christensenellaceae bacterium OttesenSCG-928-K19]|nr:polysaccharide deacetylase family protein [Christensenellaceae bacterium OttesenSCG-928-K19]
MKRAGKSRISVLLCILFVLVMAAGCAKEEQSVVIDLQAQREEFIATAESHLVEQPEGVTLKTWLETEGNYLVSADCPVVVASEAISADLQAYVEKEISNFQSEAGGMGAPTEDTGLFSLFLTYKPYVVGTELLSIKFTENAYSGKTDKKNYVESLVYNMATGARMGIEDVFDIDQPNYLATISEKIREYLLENEIVRKNLEEGLFQTGTAANAQNFSNFAITPDNKMLFFFNKGAVAPAETGTLEVCIPLSEFEAILNPENREMLFGKIVERPAAGDDEAETPAAETVSVDMSEYNQFFKSEEFLTLMPLDGIDPINDKVIALTFDDGPAPATPDLLDCLKENDAIATFFVVGDRVANFEDILKRTYDEGHEIASHSWSHAYMTEVGLDGALEEYTKANDAIEAVIGKRTLIDRPPGGKMTEELAQQIGREQIYWTVDTEDWTVKGEPDGADIVYQRIMDGAQDGAIVLLHDLHPTSVQGAIRAIPELVEEGYKLVTMTQMIQIAKARGHEIPYFWGMNTVNHKEESAPPQGGDTETGDAPESGGDEATPPADGEEGA